MNGTVYMRTSPNNERYIGQTVKSEIVRWKEHIHESKDKNHPAKYNTPLSQAIRKYGADTFSVEILESNINSEEELNEREEYWIRKHHTLVYEGCGGLNVAIGGRGHRLFTEDSFRQLYEAGYSVGEISKIVGANIRTVTEHLNTNRLENYRRGRRVALEKDPPRSVSCYTIESCEKFRSFRTAIEAAVFFCRNASAAADIYKALDGSAISAHGYLWKYDDEPIGVIYFQQKRYYANKKHSTKKQPVIKIETGESYISTNLAGKINNVDGRLINACCLGKRETAGGFHWRFKDGEKVEYVPKQKRSFKPVVCVETGVVYPSTKEASHLSGVYINVLRDCLKERIETAGGFHWKYYKEQEGDINAEQRA